MAAVAAEPGAAAAATTTAGDVGDLDPVPPVPGTDMVSDETQEYVPVLDLVHQLKDGDAVQECGQVQKELVSRPDREAAGKALAAHAEDEHIEAGCLRVGGEETTEHNALEVYETGYTLAIGERLIDRYSPVVEAANEVSNKHEPYACHQTNVGSISDSQPSVVFLHSFPAHPLATEVGLSLAEQAEPTIDYYQNPELAQHDLDCDYRALIKPTLDREMEPESGNDVHLGSEYKDAPSEDALLERPQPMNDALEPEPVSESEASLGTSMEMSYICDFSSVEPQNSGEPAEPTNFLQERQAESKPTVLCHVETVDIPPGSVDQLTPGSEVRVCLDHIIDDALVVSFRLGEKIFSGVLMDLSKRFGPYGIPITVFPKREYKDKPESMQIMTEPPAEPTQPEKEIPQSQDDSPPSQAEPAAPPKPAGATPDPSHHVAHPPALPHPWTSRPPPLFQEGAPYPPPLFIRDTYNQSLPQPPPRKIRRPKRRLYREEPTSIMNAIKLRPRQVLCDKCKGVVGGDKRETAPRRAPVSDSRGDDVKRRRSDSAATPVSKRPRNDPREEKGRGAETKRHGAASSNVRTSNSASSSSSLGHGRGGASGNRVLRGVSSTPSSSTLPNSGSSRAQLNAKKVLQGKSAIVDHTKAREVLKLARVQRRQRETAPTPLASTVSTNAHPKTMTRSAALQEAHQNQKVHFTRRLQQISGMGPVSATPLPPRMRIKPQRYRNEENQASSPPKVPCPEKGPAGQAGSRLSPPKPESGQAKAATPGPGLASALAPGTGLASAPVPTIDPASAPLPDPLLALDPTPGFSSALAPSPAPTPAPSHVLATDVARCSTTSFLCLSSYTAEASVSQPQSPPGEPEPQVELLPQASPEVCVPGVGAEDQGGPEERQGVRGSKVSTSGNLVVLMTLDSRPPLPLPDSSSSTSRCSVDSADELKSSRSSECSSTETFEFPPPGDNYPTPPPPPAPGPSSSSGPGEDADTPPPPAPPPATPPKDGEAKKRRKSSKAGVFSKSVSKCVSVEGRTTCVGDIVWAKIYGFPWWPARVVGISISRRDTGLLVRQEARVSWFGSPTTSFLPLTQLAPFLESFQSRFDKKRKGLYRKAITEAARAAKQLTPECCNVERLLMVDGPCVSHTASGGETGVRLD
ncbi:PWWP domain-containing protein 2A-like isoform X1 [Osmerus mordax]|uniref:PWWP domain-containing protein 2A isoform X1 n=1 Tax=Osmerus mordax TaxID=8014 RepID=UPI00350F75A2